MADNTKPCSKCKKVLPVSEFYLSGVYPSGKIKYRSKCKNCVKASYPRKTPLPEILPEGMKRCSKCKKVLPFSYFSKKTKNRLKTVCRECSLIQKQKWRGFSPAKIKELKRKKEERESLASDNTKKCHTCGKVYPVSDFYKRVNSEFLRSVCKSCSKKKRMIRYENITPEQVEERQKQRKERYANDPEYRIIVIIRAGIFKAFQYYSTTGKLMTTKQYGVDHEAIINKLGSPPSDGYDVEHIIPVSLFNHDDKK